MLGIQRLVLPASNLFTGCFRRGSKRSGLGILARGTTAALGEGTALAGAPESEGGPFGLPCRYSRQYNLHSGDYTLCPDAVISHRYSSV